MPIRNAQAITIRPAGLTDTTDGSNADVGGMTLLQDLVPDPTTAAQFVPRPASVQASNFAGFTGPANGEALLVVGDLAYGFIASARYAGKSEPFIYNIALGTFVTINNVTMDNTPTTQPTTGDWVPPTVTQIGNRIIFTHPGYDGATYYIGWLDFTSFASGAATGDTHTSTLIDNLSANALTVLGWSVGDLIAGAGIPADTYIASIAVGGLSITLTQAATASAAAVALTVTGGTAAAPNYGAGNTAPVQLVARPNCAGQFNGRCWYGVANSAAASDSLFPLQITNATQVVILGDNTDVTALVGLPLTSQVTGGTIQSLIAFKGAGTYYQITGDFTSTLVQSEVNGSVGTLAPNTICATPTGLSYIAPDGLRELTLAGTCTDPIGAAGTGVNQPFLNAINPTRMCMTFNQNVLRVSVQNGNVDGQPVQEYWYHRQRKIWTGPHSFPAALIEAYNGGSANTFIMFASGVDAKLFNSPVIPSPTATYTENGVAMSFAWQTDLLPDNGAMAENAVNQSNLMVALPTLENLSVLALDEGGLQIPGGLLTLAGSTAGGSVWDGFTWGTGAWGAANPVLLQQPLHWTQQLVFKQCSIRITGMSIAGFAIGNFYTQFQPLGYVTQR